MRVPLSWLRDFTPAEADNGTLAATLDRLGLVVESVERVGEGLDDVVVARVTEIRPIPGADRIRAVSVDAGGEQVDVVCGAWNFSEGDLVPLARVGAVLPRSEGQAITRRKMRGVVSNGMICSGFELGLSDDHAGILVLPATTELGAPFAEAMGIESDTVFDLDITPNRPDAMSIVGVARDLAAAMKAEFRPPSAGGRGTTGGPGAAADGVPAGHLATVTVDAADLCPLFDAKVLTGVTHGPSPEWMARRLTLAGMRPISLMVDASNYVMLELGQPSHPYDLDKLAGHGLSVRRARPDERLVTLDGAERTLHGDDCVIADAEGGPVGIAGIMGGSSSEIADGTTRVLLEVAHFLPMAIARTSKRLGLRTEASARFERGCDPEGVELAAERVCALVAAAGGGTVHPGTITVGAAPARPRLTLRTARVNTLLGTELSDADVAGYLSPLGFAVDGGEGRAEVAVPGFRPDVTQEVDLVEEVARHHGYGRIRRTVPLTSQVGSLTAYQRERRLVRQVMVGAGLTEVWTPTLLPAGEQAELGVAGDELALANPMTKEEAVLRRTMQLGLLRVLRHNAGHRYTGLRLFEVGRVFHRSPEGEALPDEREMLSAALAAPDDDAGSAVRLWRTLAESLHLADTSLSAATAGGLHPGRTAHLVAGGDLVGVVGEIDPDVVRRLGLTGRVGWLDVDLTALHRAPRSPAELRPVSVYPSSDIDLAFVVADSVPAERVEAVLRRSGGDLLVGLSLFDVYRDAGTLGADVRSLAYRLRFGALDRTLTDHEVAEVRERCVRAVEQEVGATLRS